MPLGEAPVTKIRLFSFVLAGIALLFTIPTPLSAAHFALTPAPTLTPPPPPIQPLEKNIEALALDYMNGDSHTPGLVVGVIEASGHNNVQYRGGFFGTTSLESKDRPSANTLFEIGSETKVFTATLLAFAVKEGKVKLGDPIQNYLPAGVTAPTFKGKVITLLDLATHRSGLPDEPDNKPSDKLKPYTIQDMYDWLNTYKLTYAPGSQWLYSNTGFALLGAVLSRVSDKTYDELVTTYISGPLNMPDTTQFPTDEQKTRLAVGYEEKGKPAIPFYEREGGQAVREKNGVAGGGQLYASPNDMFQFAAANLGLIGDKETQDVFAYTQQVYADGATSDAKMGLGWQMAAIDSATGARITWKDGLTLGFHSYIALFITKDKSYAVFLLGNGRTHDGLEPLASHIIKVLAGLKAS